MRFPIIRSIFHKEVRDLIRDRRTVMLILVVPALLYPTFGAAAYFMATTLLNQKRIVGISGAENLPSDSPLFQDGRFIAVKSDEPVTNSPDEIEGVGAPLTAVMITTDPKTALSSKEVDVVLVVPDKFSETIKNVKEPKPSLIIHSRDGDEKSTMTVRKLTRVLSAWESNLRAKRFEQNQLSKDFDKIFSVEDPLAKKPAQKKAADELRDQFVKVFPFILILWLAAGAIQPAVDTTAGERERGTMETLLISPVSRTEIVIGKWLATTLFGFVSVIWNVIWLALAAFVIQLVLGYPIVNPLGLIACVVMGIPLAMLFAALALTLGVFAKSTKEGQFYQLPLMLGTMPLAFMSMIPGQELTFGKSLIPVTGAMLFQQKLLSVSGDPVSWNMAPIILGSLLVMIGLALWYAARQFSRESVLFRETSAGGIFGLGKR